MPMKLGGSLATLHERPVELLQNLLRFDTTNPPGNEAACIGYIDDVLTEAGFATMILARDETRPNLVTRLAGQGHAPPLLMYGHVDVVTTECQEWTYPPFGGTVADGYIWGRGTLDMKGAVAMMMAALMRAKAHNLAPPGDVVLAVVSDEEVRQAIRFAFRNLKLVAEPGGAVALAAVLAGKIDTRGKTTVVVISGGNVDSEMFAEIQKEASG